MKKVNARALHPTRLLKITKGEKPICYGSVRQAVTILLQGLHTFIHGCPEGDTMLLVP